MESMMIAGTNSYETAEKKIQKAAEEGFAAIKEKAAAEKAAKKAMESYGIFESVKDAVSYIEKNASKYEYPLYIEEADNGHYRIKEGILKDADGIPIHNGDAIFLPDDTFFQICFTSSIPDSENPESALHKVFYKGIEEKGYEEYFPEKLREYPVQELRQDEANDTQSLFKVRKWSNAEKQAYLENDIKQTISFQLRFNKKMLFVILAICALACIIELLFQEEILLAAFSPFLLVFALCVLESMELIGNKNERLNHLKNLTNQEISKTIFCRELQKNKKYRFFYQNEEQNEESLQSFF